MSSKNLPLSVEPIESLFRRAVAADGERVAVIDPVNRQFFTSGQPKELTYAQLDAVVSRLADRFASLGLKPLDVVLVQLPNTVEMVVSLLAISRAGLIPAPVPAPWGLHEVRKAAEATRPRAILTCDKIGKQVPADRMRFCAFETPSVRSVLAFGHDLPDGVVGVSDCFEDGPVPEALPPVKAKSEHLAMITFEEARDGIVAHARTHGQLCLSAWQVAQEFDLKLTSGLLNPYLLSSITGLAAGFMTWLMAGCRFIMHHPFSTGALGAQMETSGPSHMLMPATIAANPHVAPLLNWPSVLCLGIVWPQRALNIYPKADCKIVNLQSLGELGLFAQKAVEPGRPRLSLGQTNVQIDGTKVTLSDMRLKGEGRTKSELAASTTALEARLQIRGAMVPTILGTKAPEDGYLDTGLLARPVGAMPPAAEVVGQASLVAVGGLRFDPAELEKAYSENDKIAGVRLFSADDGLTGSKLVAALVSAKGEYIEAEDLINVVASMDMAEYKASSDIRAVGAMSDGSEEDIEDAEYSHAQQAS